MVTPVPWRQRTFELVNVPIEAWPGLLQRLNGTSARARALVAGVSDAELGHRSSSHMWSPKEHIGHLADLHSLDHTRLDEYLAGAETLSAADPSNRATEAAHHNAIHVESILDRLAAGRLALVQRLELLSETDLARVAVHPRLRQRLRLIDWAYFVAEHDDHHLASVYALLKSARPADRARAALRPSNHDVRSLFEIPPDVTYLNCANLAPQLRSVTARGQDAVAAKAKPWTIAAPDWFSAAEELRGLAGAVMGTDGEAVALIPSVSYGVATAAKNARVERGQTIILLAQEFPSNVYAWRALARLRDARIVTVARENDESWTDALERAIDETTAVVSVPHCHWTDGSRVDLERVGALARKVGAMLVVDASQSLGAAPLSLDAIQPDFLMAVGYKWLLGPYGLGYLYASPTWRERGVPLEESWLTRRHADDFTRLVEYRDDYSPGARRFDMGEFPQFVLAPMSAAALRQILSWTVEYIHREASRLTDLAAGLAEEAGLVVERPEHRSGHMIGIRLPTGIPTSLHAKLTASQVYVGIRGDAIRVAPHLYNSPADIERLFAVLKS